MLPLLMDCSYKGLKAGLSLAMAQPSCDLLLVCGTQILKKLVCHHERPIQEGNLSIVVDRGRIWIPYTSISLQRPQCLDLLLNACCALAHRWRLCCGSDGQLQDHLGTSQLDAPTNMQRAAMIRRGGLRDEQADAHAGDLGALEQIPAAAVVEIIGKPRSTISHVKLHGVRFPDELQEKTSASQGKGFHRLNGIADQIDHRHLQLCSIPIDPAGLTDSLDTQVQLLRDKFVLEIQQGALNIVTQVNLALIAFHITQQHAHAINSADNPFAFSGEPAKALPKCRWDLIIRKLLKAIHRQLAVEQDRA
jgi:hypothetical protein